MASLVCGILVVCMIMVPSLATDYTVGDSSGWALGLDYTTWTSGKTFAVGDNLVFNYGGGHTVDEVSPSDYSTCTIGNAISSDSTGSTTIALKTAGTHCFICGVMGHCGTGMKLSVTVKAAGSPPDTATTPTTPTTTPATTTSPSGTNPPIYKPSSNYPDSASEIVSPILGALFVTFVASCAMAVLL
ncbi:blue copper protein-like [Mercurialis annua]|uniref:blue copper protein-like n=1 Tax=Mercurialis annua TaxID=3986 RepID=UPI002160E382|nr:blue copper protein-like [Mercurialis annua]